MERRCVPEFGGQFVNFHAGRMPGGVGMTTWWCDLGARQGGGLFTVVLRVGT